MTSPEDIEPGMIVTIHHWEPLGSREYSWCGVAMEVVDVELPYVRVKQQGRKGHTLDTRRVHLMTLPASFLDD